MFKRSLASLAAVTVVSGAVVAPANAMTTTVNDGMCTITPTAEEARLTNLTQTTLNLKKENAATIKKTLVEGQLSALRMQIENDQQELANLRPDSVEKENLRRRLEDNKKKLTAYQNFKDALNACINGQNYNSDQSGRPNNPDGSERPGGSKHPDGSERPDDSKHPDGSERPDDSKHPDGSERPDDSKHPDGSERPDDSKHPDGSERPDDSKHPDGSERPDDKRARPSINGAVIGAIVAVLGILVAALPFIKSMLPAQLRALLP
ncbi:hypothetical protein FRC0426_01891 [Corynebacterium diphtheriae]|nr:hypothetical protein FRC0426_01891 [Corynebacterium diphtheriae]